MVGGYLDKRALRKQSLDLTSKRLIETVIVVNVQEAPALQVPAQAQELGFVEPDIPVARDVQVRVVGEIGVRKPHLRRPFRDSNGGPNGDLSQQVQEARGIRIPVAPSIVLQPRDGR